ncbi:sensor histidine kinase [Streptomyces sp. Ag82_O1-15]|uniref:sensor histidine kinase n=1 Tax=Streptomyces sp. Ag82_O1-15 TaxID=1938855 RepID=UPI00359C6136
MRHPSGRRTRRDTHRAGHRRGVARATTTHLTAGRARSLDGHRRRPTNACRYAHSEVAVRAYRAPDGVRVEVIDDGPGVPRPFASRLFEPGQRADPGDGHHGAGLGLPLARRLARSAGGEVTYDPEHTPGARFVVSLPAG